MKNILVPAVALAVGLFARAAVCEPAPGILVKDGDKIAFLGDSITELGNWPAGYVNLVMEGLRRAGVKDAVKIPAGRSGDRSNRMLARIDGVLKQKPDWILISCGVNDVWHREHKGADGKHTGVDFPDYVANMRAMYDKSDAAGAKVVVLTSTMITEDENDRKNKWLVEYNEFEKAEAKKRGYPIADLNAAMWKRLGEIRRTDKAPGNKLTRDGVHMNYSGDCLMAATILTALGVNAGIGDALEATCKDLVEAGKNLKGGAYTGAGLSFAEHARLRAAAKAAGKTDMDYALDLYVEGVELAATLGSLPPPAPAAPTRPVPDPAAPTVRVKDGAKIAFVGDYYFEIGNMTGRCIDQTMRGLAAAGVKKAVKVPGWQRWEKSGKMLERLDKVLAKKPDMAVFLVGNDDRIATGGAVVPFGETKANLLAAFDKFVAAGVQVVVCTLRPGNGTAETDEFLRSEAAKRGWILADVAAAAREAKANMDYGAFEGHSLVARTVLAALGVDGETVDFMQKAILETPGGDGINIPTSINQSKHAAEVFARYGAKGDTARDVLVALLDPAKRKAWEAQPPLPVRLVLDLPAAKNNPRNGEGDFIRLDDGRILYAYTEYWGDSMLDHAPAHIVGRFSSDEGETWTEQVELVGREGKQNVMSASFLRLDAKRIALFFLRKNSDADCMPVMKVSEDEGKTWGATRECLPASVRNYYVHNNARATRLKGGRILLPLANHGASIAAPNAGYGALSCAYSDDNGETWNRTDEYRPKDAEGKPVLVQEPGVVELKDGRIYMYARTDRGCQWQGFSKDGGKTWGEFGPAPIPGPRGPATIRRVANGNLLLVWNDYTDHPEYMKAGPGWLVGMRTPLTLAISRDEGKTWGEKMTVESDPKGFFCYFSLFETKDGGLLLGYYNKPYLTGSCVKKVRYPPAR